MPDIRIRTVAGRPVPQINVKDDRVWWGDPVLGPMIDELGEDKVSAIYEGVQEDFWQDIAPDIAREHGYSGEVYSAGRSDGWLEIPEVDEETLSACNPCYGDSGQCADAARFEAFASDIRGAVIAAQEMFLQRLKEAHADLERRRDENAIRSNN
jgi:hypothetical protein